MRKRRIQKVFYLFICCILLYGLVRKFTTSKFKPVERLRFKARPFFLYQCPVDINRQDLTVPVQNFAYNSSFSNETIPRVLLITQQDSTYNKVLADFVRFLKIPVRVEVLDGSEFLLELILGRFSLIVFESYHSYSTLSEDNRKILNDYCQKNKVGIISFVLRPEDATSFHGDTGINVLVQQQVTDIHFDDRSIIPYIGKKGVKFSVEQTSEHWTIFNFENSKWKSFISCSDINGDDCSLAIHDSGTVEHLVFGQDLRHFLMKIGFLDSLLYMTRGSSTWSLESFIEIDIDDIFVGQAGTRLVPEDIQALIDSQNFLRQHIEDFNYTLGFSGHFFKKGDSIENLADELLMSQADNFLWFPHMWHHNHAHEYELTYLLALMTQNAMFAKNFNLRTILNYAVSPQHSGVYPIHEPLYESWKTIWNVSVTSTEEYPHLKPAWNRRGFIYKNISILPRQTCGLFTHTHFFHAYPDGFNQLKNNLFGGDLFSTILLNQFLIFMTHQQNYGNDRLAHYTFHNLLIFAKCWTNLKFKWIPPKIMAEKYFQKHPEQKTMIYTDPCSDARHKKMLSINVTCDYRLPNVIIVGPQKTGTSALLSFLKLHPNVTSNINVEKSFEELQFFGGFHYEKGFEWYKNKFITTKEHSIIIEKTANYFDNPVVPDLISSMLPETKIIILLMDPVDRAYSWFQHMKSHNDTIATTYSPEELFSMTPDHLDFEKTNRLRQRCLKPGYYAENIDRWLDYFPPSQLIFIDANSFRLNPAPILEDLAITLELSPLFLNYAEHLKYNKEKGFYCALINGKTKCLGASKGRKYMPMSNSLRAILNSQFAPFNRSLYKLLKRYKYSVPEWLTNFIS